MEVAIAVVIASIIGAMATPKTEVVQNTVMARKCIEPQPADGYALTPFMFGWEEDMQRCNLHLPCRNFPEICKAND